MIALISLTSLLTATTKTQATQAILDTATALGFDVTSWQANRAGRTLIAIIATIYSAFTVVAVQFAAAGGFLSTATAGWLRFLAQELFNVFWNPASYATGTVTLTNTAAVPYTFSPGGLTFSYQPPTGSAVSFVNTYVSTSYGALPGLATLPANGTITIPIQALVPGSGSNVPGLTALTMSPTFLLVSAATVTAIAGADDEGDAALRSRVDAAKGALAPNGAPGALAYWAQSVRLDSNSNPVFPPPVSDQATYDAAVPLDVNRVRVVGATTGIVNVYLGGSGGAADATTTSIVDAALQTYVVPIGITEVTGIAGVGPSHGLGCLTTTININYSAQIDPSFGVSIADAKAAIFNAFVDYFASPQLNPIGGKTFVLNGQGYIYVYILYGVMYQALPAAGLPPALISPVFTTPLADIPIATNTLATLGSFSGTVVEVPQT